MLQQAVQRSLTDFLVYAGAAHALLIDVGRADSAVAQGLVASFDAGARLDGPTWITERSATRDSVPPDGVRRSPSSIPPALLEACCFPVAIRKREALALPGRVSIGRAIDSDVVLLDSSVSRTHCWLETNARGRVVIEDCGSSNGVRVNRAAVATSRELLGGEILQLGRVRACVCPLDKFWSLVRGT